MKNSLPTLGEVLHGARPNDIVKNSGGKTWNFDKCSNHGKTKKKPMKKYKK